MRVLYCLVAALCLIAVPAVAEVVVQEKQEIVLQVFVECANNGAGEMIEVSGPLHTLITATINANSVSGKQHFQPQGISGVGLTTGQKYQAVGLTQSSFKGSLVDGRYVNNFVNNFRMIGQGPGNNFSIHENAHVTIAADGSVTVQHDNFRATCN